MMMWHKYGMYIPSTPSTTAAAPAPRSPAQLIGLELLQQHIAPHQRLRGVCMLLLLLGCLYRMPIRRY
jgi:hypothetical protein